VEFTISLNTVWFSLIGVLFTGYAILDGFDLGVGALHLFARTDAERRVMLNSIGPVWDGNEVWLITAGGALFAAFPHVYATAFSGFYTAVILLLLMLIFRAVAIEFRSKRMGTLWRSSWDTAFSISSIVIALLAGVALGNVVQGVPIGPDKEFAGNFLGLFNPYALLVGVTTLALFIMHGAIYLTLKTDGDFQNRIRGWVKRTVGIFVVFYIVLTTATLTTVPHMTERFREVPLLLIFPVLTMLAIANIPRETTHRREFRAFLSSAAAIAGMLALFGIGLYPNILISSTAADFSLNIYNAASSKQTLRIMLIIAATGMPFVIAYTTSIYWVFRGKVRLDPMSY
jgi:cytochrome d ubiquinol oxidase subunit II